MFFLHSILALALLALAPVRVLGSEPYQDFSQKGVNFYGPGRELEAPDSLSAVRLGLTGPAEGRAGGQLRLGVELAVEEANAAGGYRGLPYEIIFRADDGPWGVVAQQVIALSQEDEVWAVIGSLDGERAHAAELVAAKLWVPVVTPAAGDLTIDYANVPWVFRLMPDDRSQADLLLRAAREPGWKRLALVSEGVRDARLASERIREAAGDLEEGLVLHVEYAPYASKEVIPRLLQADVDVLLVWGRTAGAVELIAGLRHQGMKLPILVPAGLVLPEVAALGDDMGVLFGAAPLDMEGDGELLREFLDRCRQESGAEPSHVAAYAYEATRMVIAAIERAGLNRARIRDEIAQMRFEGVSGQVSFNSLGGYQREPVLVELRAEKWVRK